MKKALLGAMKIFIAVLPAIAMFSVTVSANTISTPMWGQPKPPTDLKKYRKF